MPRQDETSAFPETNTQAPEAVPQPQPPQGIIALPGLITGISEIPAIAGSILALIQGLTKMFGDIQSRVQTIRPGGNGQAAALANDLSAHVDALDASTEDLAAAVVANTGHQD